MAKFNFIIDDDRVLNELMDRTNRQSKADVVRDALALYNYLARRTAEGDKILLQKGDQSPETLLVTTLEPKPSRSGSRG